MLRLSGNRLLGYLVIGLLSGMFYKSAKAQSDSLMNDTIVYEVSEKMPEYSEGIEKFYQLLTKNMKLDCIKDSTNAINCSKIWCEFIVDKNGNAVITDVNYCKEKNTCLKIEMERIFQMAAKWIPGEIKGIPVAVRMRIPIIVHLK